MNRFSISVGNLEKRGLTGIRLYRIKKIRIKSLGNKQNNPYRLLYGVIQEEQRIVLIQFYEKLSQKTYIDENRVLRYFKGFCPKSL